MAVNPKKFNPISVMNNGNRGLLNNGPSKAKITGDGLGEGMPVVVNDPTAGLNWTGPTGEVHGNHTFVTLMLSTGGGGGRSVADDTVSVTVDGVPISPNPTVPVGPPPTILDGNYTVACNGDHGNDYKWLESDGDDGVDLGETGNSAPSWTFNAVPFSEGNCYTIYSAGNGYLNWENDDNGGTDVTFEDNTGPGTTWQLTGGNNIMAVSDDSSNQPNDPYLNGNTSTGDVDMKTHPDSHHGTSWTLTSAARRV